MTYEHVTGLPSLDPGSPRVRGQAHSTNAVREMLVTNNLFCVSGDLFLPDEHAGPDGVYRDERLAHLGEVLEVTIVNVIGFLLCFPRLRF